MSLPVTKLIRSFLVSKLIKSFLVFMLSYFPITQGAAAFETNNIFRERSAEGLGAGTKTFEHDNGSLLKERSVNRRRSVWDNG